MKFTDEFKEAAGKFFDALKKLDGKPVENSTTVAEPVKAEVTPVPTPDVPPAPTVDASKDVDEVAELKKKVEDLTAELAMVKVNLNSSVEAATNLTEKLAVILNAPAKGELKEVQNSRPTQTKEDFSQWNVELDKILNGKA